MLCTVAPTASHAINHGCILNQEKDHHHSHFNPTKLASTTLKSAPICVESPAYCVNAMNVQQEPEMTSKGQSNPDFKNVTQSAPLPPVSPHIINGGLWQACSLCVGGSVGCMLFFLQQRHHLPELAARKHNQSHLHVCSGKK